MEFLYEYGLFLAKAITWVIAIGIIVALVVSAGQKSDSSTKGAIEVSPLNEHYDELKESLTNIVYDDQTLKELQKQKQKQRKQEKKFAKKETQDKPYKKRVYVLTFEGDIKASAVDNLRQEVTTLLTLVTDQDEVVVELESPGGMVHSYGLASSQLARLRDKGIPLTACVDKVAASGGYMMACVANKICAAPFAIIGSIGVLAQLPNFHRLLKKNDVDFELLTAGEYKRTLTVFGENTDDGRKKFQDDLETTHTLFKDFVRTQRPVVDIDKVATGEIWFGSQAKEQNLVDELITSDDYLFAQAKTADIYRVQYVQKKNLAEKLGISVQSTLEGIANKALNALNSSRFMQ